MRKQIICNVIKSIPLNKTTDRFIRSDMLNSAIQGRNDAVAANINSRHTNNTNNYTNRMNISKVDINYYPMGQILDCYA